eukprot:s8428_g1.t1
MPLHVAGQIFDDPSRAREAKRRRQETFKISQVRNGFPLLQEAGHHVEVLVALRDQVSRFLDEGLEIHTSILRIHEVELGEAGAEFLGKLVQGLIFSSMSLQIAEYIFSERLIRVLEISKPSSWSFAIFTLSDFRLLVFLLKAELKFTSILVLPEKASIRLPSWEPSTAPLWVCLMRSMAVSFSTLSASIL